MIKQQYIFFRQNWNNIPNWVDKENVSCAGINDAKQVPNQISDLLYRISDLKKSSIANKKRPPLLVAFSVREGGVEPPHLAAYAPETYASTNSAIPASHFFNNLRLF